jgi:hypothetical protein
MSSRKRPRPVGETGTFLEDLDAPESSPMQSLVASFWLHPFFAIFHARVRKARLAKRRPLRASLWRRLPCHQARYRDPDGRQVSKTFHRKIDAERWLTTVESSKLTGGYVDPKAGRISFRDYAEVWRSRQLWRESSAARIESDLRVHLYPAIGSTPLAAVRPSDLDVLVKSLAGRLAPTTVEGVYRLAATVFKAAIRDRIITTTPCVDVKLPEKPRREVVPLTVSQVAELSDLVPDRYRALIVLGAGMRAPTVRSGRSDRGSSGLPETHSHR